MQHIHRFIRSLITQLPPHGHLGKPVTQKRMPPVLPFTSLLIILPHYTLLKRRQGVILLVSACFQSWMGRMLNEKC